MDKNKIIRSIQGNIKDYQKLLQALQMSDIDNKAERIAQCRYAIEKQKKMLSNITRWKDN